MNELKTSYNQFNMTPSGRKISTLTCAVLCMLGNIFLIHEKFVTSYY